MTKDDKMMSCIVGYTIRDIINQVNEYKLQKEDIVSIFSSEGRIFLIYYK